MPALDTCYASVVRALEKAGWKVDPRPYPIQVSGRRNPLLADIKADREGLEIIIAEIKCFEANAPDELYSAIGQYLIYRYWLNRAYPERPLYLAIPSVAYHGIFQEMGFGVVRESHIKLIVVNTTTEVIEQWNE